MPSQLPEYSDSVRAAVADYRSAWCCAPLPWKPVVIMSF